VGYGIGARAKSCRARRAIERRAVEAVIYGMPAVNLDLMLQAMIGRAAGRPARILAS
jgi:hypothetical protein